MPKVFRPKLEQALCERQLYHKLFSSPYHVKESHCGVYTHFKQQQSVFKCSEQNWDKFFAKQIKEKRQRSGTDTIEFHILPQTPYGKGACTTKTALKLKQHKWKAKRTALSQQIASRLSEIKRTISQRPLLSWAVSSPCHVTESHCGMYTIFVNNSRVLLVKWKLVCLFNFNYASTLLGY